MAASSTGGVGSSVVIQKPVINWGELSSPLETTAKKTSRQFGIFLVVLGVFAGVVRQLAAARMTASPDTIIRTCATLQVVMLVSLVAGAVLWFFNRLTQDLCLLLQQRSEVKDQIGKTSLAELRTKYTSPFVLSNAELNQWIRYLAGSASFNDFRTKQSDKIFDLPLEDETIKVLKDRYLLDVNDEAIPIFFESFIAQKPFKFLLSESERADVKKLVANHEAARKAARGGDCAAESYSTFISVQGVSILSHLNDANVQSLVQGFCDAVIESGVGIRDLKENRAEELKAFGSNIEKWLFELVANREGSQHYEIFKPRNGDEAICYITNTVVKEDLFNSFSKLVIGKKDGLVKTREDFGRTIGMFGEGAAESIDTLVLNDEIGALTRGVLTYLDFRRRNGIEAIQFTMFGNENLKQQIKPCFLKLPASDLIGPAYEVDRKLFGITIEDIRSELSGRWNGMTFAGIFQTDREGFVAAVAGPNRCFVPQDWTQKAVQDTAAMSIKDILSTYRVLFRTGVLTANDEKFKNRLAAEIAPITEWTALINTYGAFVFEQGLLVSTQVENLVRNFIRIYAESYLNNSFEGEMLKYVEVIEKYYPVLTQKIEDAKAAVAAQKQRYADWLKGHEAEFERMIHERQGAAEREIAKFQSDQDITEKERAKNTADRECSEKKAAYKDLTKEMKACEEEIRRDEEAYRQKGTVLGELRSKQAYIPANVQWNRAQAESAVSQAQHNLQQAVAYVQRDPLHAQLEDLKTKESKLQLRLEKIESMQQEKDKLSDEVKEPAFTKRKKELEEKIADPDKTVTGLKAAEEAKKETKEAPKLLAEMRAKEERLAEVTRELSQTNYQRIKTELIAVRSVKAGIVSALAQAEFQAQLPLLRAEESRALQELRQLRALEGELQQINSLSGEIEQLRSRIDQKTGALGEKKKRCKESLKQLRDAEARKQSTVIAYNISAQELARVTAETLQACRVDIEKMGHEKAHALLKAKSTHGQTLKRFVRNFRSSI